MQLPIGETDQFNAVIDLVKMEEIRWLDKYGNEMESIKVDKSHAYYK